MTNAHPFPVIELEWLVPRVREYRQKNFRLVQIGATHAAGQIELTYSFDHEGHLSHVRVIVAPEARVPSVTSVYWCAFLYENEIHDLFGLHFEGLAVDFGGHFYQTRTKRAFVPLTANPVVPAIVSPAADPRPGAAGTLLPPSHS